VLLAIGFGTLAQYAFGIDLTIDRVLFGEVALGPYPGRSSPPTALALTALALALLTFDARAHARVRPPELFTLFACVIALVGLIGQLGAGALYHASRAPVVGMSPPTAIALTLIAAGMLCERPQAGVMAVATSHGPGGVLFRRLVLPAMLAPLLLGVVVTRLFSGLEVEQFALVTATVSTLICVLGPVLLVLTAQPLDRARDALEANRARTRDLIDQASDAIFLSDVDGRYMDVNRAGCQLLGLSREQILGMTVADLLPAEDLQRLLAAREKQLRGGIEFGEWSLRHREGYYIPTEVSAKILPDGRWQAIVRDIRERKAAEKRASKTEAQQRLLAGIGLLLSSSRDRSQIAASVVEHLARELADFCIIDLLPDLDASEPALRKVGHRDPDNRELAASLEATSLDARDMAWWTSQSERTILLSRPTQAQLDTIAQSPEMRRILREFPPTSLITVPLQVPGRLLGALSCASRDPRHRYDSDDVAFVDDLAQRVAMALENARLFSVAAKAVRSRDEVLSVVAHDLRGPLGAVALVASTLVRPQDERRDPMRKAAERIERSVASANHLIEDLLDITRIEQARGIAIAPKPAPVDKLVKEAAEMLGSAAAEADIELEVTVAGDAGLACADEPRIVQVLVNLIGNALKFTPRGGRVRVAADRVGSELQCSVTDTGPGVPAEQLAHLFDRFWQAQRADRRGIGLGLAIAKGIVEAHGGRIWAQSEGGRGSRFVFTLHGAGGGPPKARR
jgi:PAS domain S-box-containing protein